MRGTGVPSKVFSRSSRSFCWLSGVFRRDFASGRVYCTAGLEMMLLRNTLHGLSFMQSFGFYNNNTFFPKVSFVECLSVRRPERNMMRTF